MEANFTPKMMKTANVGEVSKVFESVTKSKNSQNNYYLLVNVISELKSKLKLYFYYFWKTEQLNLSYHELIEENQKI